MPRRALLASLGIAAVILLVGCRPLPPAGGPDRAESVDLPAGRCLITWWLSDLVADPPAKAQRVAANALEQAEVSGEQWEGWYRLLGDDPDLSPSTPAVRLQGSAYLEAVREDVRDALDRAGYPDTDRLIEVYSTLSCR